MPFELSIETENAAFAGPNLPLEIARLLRRTAERIEQGAIGGSIHDSNGNKCGEFSGADPHEDEGE